MPAGDRGEEQQKVLSNFFFQAEDGIRDTSVTGVQTCALPICTISIRGVFPNPGDLLRPGQFAKVRTVVDTKQGALLVPQRAVRDLQGQHEVAVVGDRKSTRLNSSHRCISYAVFCLKKNIAYSV